MWIYGTALWKVWILWTKIVNRKYESTSSKDEKISVQQSATSENVNTVAESIHLIDRTVDVMELINADLKNRAIFMFSWIIIVTQHIMAFRLQNLVKLCVFCSVLQLSRMQEEVFETLRFLPEPILNQWKKHTIKDLLNYRHLN